MKEIRTGTQSFLFENIRSAAIEARAVLYRALEDKPHEVAAALSARRTTSKVCDLRVAADRMRQPGFSGVESQAHSGLPCLYACVRTPRKPQRQGRAGGV